MTEQEPARPDPSQSRVTGRLPAIEQQLRESEARYRTIVETAQEGIWIIDPDALTTFVNGKLAEMLGYTVDEMLGQPLYRFMDEEEEAIARDQLARRREGVSERLESRFLRKDGSHLWAIVSANPLTDSAGAFCGALAMVTDISERKAAEEALRESEERFRESFEHAAIGKAVADLDGRFLQVNRALCELTGYPETELVGKSFRDVTHPDDLQSSVEPIGRLLAGEIRSYQLRRRYLRKTGEVVSILLAVSLVRGADGRPAHLLGEVQDVSEAERAEGLLRENQAHLQALIGSLDDIVFEFDADGTYLNVWTGDESLLARPRSEIVGARVTEVLGEELGRPYLEVFRRVLASGRSESVEYTLDVIGGTRWFHARVTPVASPDGSYRTVCVLPRDITARKHAEEALRFANLKLETALEEVQRVQERTIRQERLHALGEMASGIAHDFNNALTVILGFSELLLRDTRILDDREKATVYLELVRKAAGDAAGVVRRLREFYRPRDLEDEGAAVDLHRVVEDSISMTRPRWSNQALARGRIVRVETELGPVPEIWGDEAALREVFTNLIFNAVDAIPGDGSVTFRTRLEGDQVVVEVSDTGTGMSEETRRRSLEPFFSTKGEHGSGLGLSMVYGAVTRHRGTLEIESGLGRGTTVTLRLPTGRPSRSDAAPAPAVPWGLPLRVLLVDDEPAVRDVVAGYLALDGHRVQEAADGAEALRQLEAEPYDLMIVDRAMPGMTGDELAAAVAAGSPATAVLLLSGFGDLMLAAGERPPGVDVVIGKPIAIAGLRQAVARALAARDARRSDAGALTS